MSAVRKRLDKQSKIDVVADSNSNGSVWRSKIQLVGLLAGPLWAALSFGWLPIEYADAAGQPVAFSLAGRATLAVMIWMAVWWLTEAIDISVTALLPIVLFPLLGIATMNNAAAPFADPLIFLFMGGFFQALSMRRWGLDKRIALATLRMVGTKPVNMVGGFMLVTAMISAFVSNTATTAMMLPIALSVVALTVRKPQLENATGTAGLSVGQQAAMNVVYHPEPDSDSRSQATKNFATCLMLGIAYASSIGGVATIIGTPPNVFLISFLNESLAEPFRTEISFARWLIIGVPFAVVFLPIVWILLTRLLFPIHDMKLDGGHQLIEREYQLLGSLNRGEWATLIAFGLTATAWITRPWLAQIPWEISGQVMYPLARWTDGGIAMTGALLLFVIPARSQPGEYVMNWSTAEQLPWGILILFGGGLSLAAAVEANGVAEFVGCQSSHLHGLSEFWLVLIVVVVVVFLTELTSNIATTATLLPVLSAMAPGLGIHPCLLIVPTTIAASCAFMLPIATPPNAIVFASGEVTIPQMVKAGLWLNAVSIVLITAMTFFIIKPLLGI